MSNITVPYSVNAINGHSSSYSKGNYTFTTTINLPKVQPTYLWFQHADQSADIYVDNVKVTTHWGGYNAFFTDISEYVHAGENEIKVILCNTTRSSLAPCSADFNFNATLGKVKVITSPVMPDMFYGYDGFHITATNVSSAAATLTIKTSVPVGATVVCKIDDDDSNYHFYEEKPSTGSEMSFVTTITNPTLWNGKINPHLYDVTLEIYKNGDLYHRFQRGYGIRYYSYVYNYTLPNNETYTGFLLNGSPYLLRGVCMHDDLKEKANALDDADYTQEFAVIQEVGCNFIRLAHYPHPKEVYDWCDRLGIIVQTEVPLVNNIKSTQPEDYYTHLEGQYYDMVTQHYNHPCIVFWGLGNEFNAQIDSDGGAFACTKLEHFRDIIKTYDTERMVGCVLNANSSNPRSTVGGADLDWYGCNIYVGWYSNTGSNNPTSQLNTRLNNVKDRPIAYSEYGCGGTQSCHSETPSSTTNKGSGGARHDIEYQMWYHEGHIAAIKNFPQLIFTSEWQFFDVAVSSRNEGYTECLDGVETVINDDLRRLNDKGLVERDHITKKDTFYLYKAWWNPTPFVHICQKNYEKYDDRVIKCYTNDGNSLTLYVNNTEIETVSVTNNIATFTAMDFNPGDVIRVSGTTTNDTLTIHDYSQDYLTFDVKSSGNITWKKSDSSANSKTISYSKNGGEWTNITSTTSGASISVTAGDKIRIKGDNGTYHSDEYYYNYFNCNSSCKFNIFGNIMSLIYGDNFIGKTTFKENFDRIFYQLFNGCTGIVSVKRLILPATTLASSCYNSMFSDCTSLTTAPVLPATTMVSSCYYRMFFGCTSLTTAPALPATTLANDCYGYMFYGCTSLTTAPVLPATTLANYCYEYMFKGCTSLTKAPELPATILLRNCYGSMFYGCSSLNYIKCLATNTTERENSYVYNCTSSWVYGVAETGTFVKNKNMNSWYENNTSGIPMGWTIYEEGIVDSPLTFTALEDGTFSFTTNNLQYSLDNGSTWSTLTAGSSTPTVTTGNKIMFKQTGLTPNSDYGIGTFSSTGNFNASGNVMSLYYGDNFVNQTDLTGKSYAFKYLFDRCNKLVDVSNLILPATTLAERCYTGMFYGCTSLTTTPELPATTLANYCYNAMFDGCISLTTAPELPATTLALGCYSTMFSGCTSLTTAPELPATTLEIYCYSNMFLGCASLTTAPALPATTLVEYCYQSMFSGCTNLNYIKCYATDISALGCVGGWVYHVASTGTFVKHPSMSSWTTGDNGIPTGWVSENANNYELEYLTFDIKSDGDIKWTYSKTGTSYNIPRTISYSKNGGSWTDITGTSDGVSISVNIGDKVRFKGINDYYCIYHFDYSNLRTYTYSNSFEGTATYDVYGNFMSMFYGDNFIEKSIKQSYILNNTSRYVYPEYSAYMFSSNLISAENLILPSKIDAPHSYHSMFSGCTSLTTAPELPATTLASHCYHSMFYGCTSLTNAPVLPATTLAEYCYHSMFYGCTSLTNAPVLPATTLAEYCYYQMFYGCTNLNYIECYAINKSASSCVDSWVYHVASTGMFVKHPSMSSWSIGTSGIPTGWTCLNYGDNSKYLTFNVKTNGTISWKNSDNDLDNKTIYYSKNGGEWNSLTSSVSGDTLSVSSGDIVRIKGTNSTYKLSENDHVSFVGTSTFDVEGNIMSLFYGDDFYNKSQFPDSSTYQLNKIFYGCTGLISSSGLNLLCKLTEGCYCGMFQGCTNLITVPKLPSTTLVSNCYESMFSGCTSLTTVPELPVETLAENCYKSMFSDCTSLTTAPVLPATTLVESCYQNMFYGCTLLNYIDCKATDISATNCTTDWVNNVASTGTFVKHPSMSSWTTGDSGIPTGWTFENDYNYSYLTFNAITNCTLYWCTRVTQNQNKINYSINDGEWTQISTNTQTGSDFDKIVLSAGDELRLKGSYSKYNDGNDWYCKFIQTEGSLNISGNIMSLINGDSFVGKTTLSQPYCFKGFFNRVNVVSAENLALPATTLSNYCYDSLFSSDELLVYPPKKLPATTLKQGCYSNMFKCCINMITTPGLPATTLAQSCYSNMFSFTKITTAPELPVTTLVSNCYNNMFSNCTCLTTAPELPATTLADGCYSNMFYECTGLTTAPELPATTLLQNCYYEMFTRCTKLNYIKCLAMDISATDCTTDWVLGVGRTGIFVQANDMMDWTVGNNGIPIGWNDDSSESDSDYYEDDGYLKDYLTFDIKSNGNIIWKKNSADAKEKTISYSKNNGTWNTITSTIEGIVINVTRGDSVRFKGYNSQYYGCSFEATSTFDVYGNIMSLIYNDNFYGTTTLLIGSTFRDLFLNCSNLQSAKNLILPATTLSTYCYRSMFSGCTGLTNAPVLPATTLAYGCYQEMFSGCTGLTTTPTLPATTLADYSYYNMFNGCTSLTTTTVLPATIMKQYCYYNMFHGCTSLTTAPTLPATTLATSCYSSMFNGCTSLTNAPELPATTLASNCYTSMFSGCTGLTTAPVLPATTLASYCYSSMFNGCTSLTTAPVLPATTLTSYCYRNMFYGCSSLNYIKCLATNISASYCTNSWVSGVAASGIFAKDPNMSSWTTGVNGIPSGWTIDYSQDYLTFDVKSDGNITWTVNNSSNAKTISYSKNDGTWTDITSTTSGATIPVVTGDKVRFKGDNSTYGSGASSSCNRFGGTATYEAYGNIMSLVDSTSFGTLTTLNSNYTFSDLFYNCASLLSVTNLSLPATTLTNDCYEYMFYGCTSLTTAPTLPATTLATGCYKGMFHGCSSLTTAPVLPATTLAAICYYCMFYDCTSLTTAPTLPATTLTSQCYGDMFCGCTSLTTAPTLPATTLAENCYCDMFSGCTSLTTAPTLPVMNLASGCYWKMFGGCTSLTTAPVLPATTLQTYCYYEMFSGCTSLTTAPDLPALLLKAYCYASMFEGCSNLNYVKCLATNISASYCVHNWLRNVKTMGTFVKNSNMSSWKKDQYGNGVPQYWTIIDA